MRKIGDEHPMELFARRDCYSFVTKQFQEQSAQTTEAHEDRSRVGQVIDLVASGPTRQSQLPLVKPHPVSYPI